MRTIVGSLIWKEWHEHKWKLAAITAVLWGVGAIVLRFSPVPDSLGLAIVLVVICTVILAVFSGLGAAANERSRNTMPFLQALPVPMWQAAVIKVVVGLVTLIVPIVLALGLIYFWTLIAPFIGTDINRSLRDFEEGALTVHWFFDWLLVSSAMAASFFIWAAASGVNRKDEVGAGAVALAVMAGWWLLLLSPFYITIEWFHHDDMPRWIVALAFCTAPAGFVQLADPGLKTYLPLGAGIAFATHFVLATWYVRRFGHVTNLEVRSHQAAAQDSSRLAWLSAPRKSALQAIAWKQFRESVPLVLVGLAGVIGVTTLILMTDPYVYFFQYDRLAEMAAGVLVVVSFFVAIVVGIGVCLNDASPGLNTFWRSRPINPDVWFWTKFGTGIAVLLAAMYGPLLAIVLTLHRHPSRFLLDSESVLHAVTPFLIFAAAVMTTCLVRQAIYAAILSFAVVYLGVVAGIGLWFVAGLLHLVPLGTGRWWEPTEAQVAFGMALSFVTSTLIAWLAVRHDWGRKSRY